MAEKTTESTSKKKAKSTKNVAKKSPNSKLSFDLTTVALLVGATLIFIGSFLDWATVGGFGVSGFDGSDGKFTALAAILLLLIGTWPFFKNTPFALSATQRAYSAIILATTTGLIAANDGGNVNDVNNELQSSGLSEIGGQFLSVSIGLGIWFVLLGGLLAALGAGLIPAKTKLRSLRDFSELSSVEQQRVGSFLVVYFALVLLFYFI